MQRWKQKMSQIRNTQQMESSAWVNLKIRTATLADATQIFQIANSLKINYKDPQENGFLVYTKSAQDYGKIIESTPYFYVAERDGEVIGFLYCFDDVVMKKLEDNDLLKGEDKTFPFLYSQKRPFVLADQMGIIKKYSYQGIGKALFDKFFEDIIGKNIDAIYAEILHGPIANKASISFCKSMGFELIAEMANSDRNNWGIYKIEREED